MNRPSFSLLFCLLALGCPGSASYPRDGKLAGGEPIYTPLPDGVGKPDHAKAGDLKPRTEKGGSDIILNTTVGGPCPCAAPLLCVLKACRQPCNQVICNGATNCGVDEACINTELNTPVCVPGVGTGQPCTTTAFCVAGSLCLATDPQSGAGKCYATCAGVGQPCAQGTCSTIKNNPCFFCL